MRGGGGARAARRSQQRRSGCRGGPASADPPVSMATLRSLASAQKEVPIMPTKMMFTGTQICSGWRGGGARCETRGSWKHAAPAQPEIRMAGRRAGRPPRAALKARLQAERKFRACMAHPRATGGSPPPPPHNPAPNLDDLPVEGLHLDQARQPAGVHQQHAQRALVEQQRVGGAELKGGEGHLVQQHLHRGGARGRERRAQLGWQASVEPRRHGGACAGSGGSGGVGSTSTLRGGSPSTRVGERDDTRT